MFREKVKAVHNSSNFLHTQVSFVRFSFLRTIIYTYIYVYP